MPVDRKFILKLAQGLGQRDPKEWAANAGFDHRLIVNLAKQYAVLSADKPAGIEGFALFQLGYEVRRAQERD